MFELRFTKKADETFDYIQEQIANRWGYSTVKKFDERVYHVLELISKTPFACQAVENHQDIRKAHIHKNCSLFYKVREAEVVVIVLFFWDNR